jgi:hypothetical protein
MKAKVIEATKIDEAKTESAYRPDCLIADFEEPSTR